MKKNKIWVVTLIGLLLAGGLVFVGCDDGNNNDNGGYYYPGDNNNGGGNNQGDNTNRTIYIYIMNHTPNDITSVRIRNTNTNQILVDENIYISGGGFTTETVSFSVPASSLPVPITIIVYGSFWSAQKSINCSDIGATVRFDAVDVQ